MVAAIKLELVAAFVGIRNVGVMEVEGVKKAEPNGSIEGAWSFRHHFLVLRTMGHMHLMTSAIFHQDFWS